MPGIGGQDDRNGGSACSGIYSLGLRSSDSISEIEKKLGILHGLVFNQVQIKIRKPISAKPEVTHQ